MGTSKPAPAPSTYQYRIVLVSGLATTALVLFAVYLMVVHWRFNPMLFYFDYVFPVGALIVGLAAGSGYGIASWISGVKITKALLLCGER